MTQFTYHDSPVGPLLLLSNGTHLTGLYMNEHKCGPSVNDHWTRQDTLPLFCEARAQLEAYFAGQRQTFTLSLAPQGTPFQRKVWEILATIPYGETDSYGTLAQRLGSPGAARAVGAANGANPLSIIVPCHRVVGAGGALTGYAGGAERKQFLLELERGVK